MGSALEVPKSSLISRGGGVDNVVVRHLSFVLLYMSAWVIMRHSLPCLHLKCKAFSGAQAGQMPGDCRAGQQEYQAITQTL